MTAVLRAAPQPMSLAVVRGLPSREGARRGEAMRRIVVTEFITLDEVIEDLAEPRGFEHGGRSFKFSDPEEME